MSPFFRRLAGVLAVSLTLFAGRALACSVCGCDPAALTLGLDRPSTNSVRLAVEDRYLTKESGLDSEFEGERENRMLLRAQFAPARKFVAQVEVPFFLWRDHIGTSGSVDDTARGLGDVQLTGRYELLRAGGFVPRHVLSVVAGLKLPTGANNRTMDGEVDEHIQLGTGSWDPSLGLWYTFGDHPWTWYTGGTVRLNTQNSRHFQYGNVLSAIAGVRRAFFNERFFLSLEGQARYAGYDHGSSGTDPNSGGFLGYATGGAAFAIGMDLLARIQVQVPVVSDLRGLQNEHTVAFAGLSWDFAM
ncbi:MAG TPA: transporter [Myxococcales bacterium]